MFRTAATIRTVAVAALAAAAVAPAAAQAQTSGLTLASPAVHQGHDGPRLRRPPLRRDRRRPVPHRTAGQQRQQLLRSHLVLQRAALLRHGPGRADVVRDRRDRSRRSGRLRQDDDGARLHQHGVQGQPGDRLGELHQHARGVRRLHLLRQEQGLDLRPWRPGGEPRRGLRLRDRQAPAPGPAAAQLPALEQGHALRRHDLELRQRRPCGHRRRREGDGRQRRGQAAAGRSGPGARSQPHRHVPRHAVDLHARGGDADARRAHEQRHADRGRRSGIGNLAAATTKQSVVWELTGPNYKTWQLGGTSRAVVDEVNWFSATKPG